MKAAPVMRALNQHRDVRQSLVHTGQHYDSNMSDVFFSQLDFPAPDVNLDVGSGSHARQTAEIMSRIEPVLLERKPDMVLVYGDVNSTVAAALVCSKLLIRIAHVEASIQLHEGTELQHVPSYASRPYFRGLLPRSKREPTVRRLGQYSCRRRAGLWNPRGRSIHSRQLQRKPARVFFSLPLRSPGTTREAFPAPRFQPAL